MAKTGVEAKLGELSLDDSKAGENYSESVSVPEDASLRFLRLSGHSECRNNNDRYIVYFLVIRAREARPTQVRLFCFVITP